MSLQDRLIADLLPDDWNRLRGPVAISILSCRSSACVSASYRLAVDTPVIGRHPSEPVCARHLHPPGGYSAWDVSTLDFSFTRRAARGGGWLLLAVIAVLSLIPPSYRPVTALGHSLEHFLIHLLLGVAFGVGYAGRWWLLALVLVGFLGAIEFAQLFVPGRHARLEDLLIDAGAACLGIGLAWLGKVVTSGFSGPSRP